MLPLIFQLPLQVDWMQLHQERFLAASAPAASARPHSRTALRQWLGRDEHQAIAAEMARFA